MVKQYILPRTAELACRYADHPGLVGDHQISRPTFYVCHAWSNSFALLVDALSRHLTGADPACIFLFLDIFSVRMCGGGGRDCHVVQGESHWEEGEGLLTTLPGVPPQVNQHPHADRSYDMRVGG